MKYKLLGKSGLRVSELCLGTMAFGEDMIWGCGKAESEKIFNCFTNAGGNFIDTSNIYAKGIGEDIIGDLTQPNRDDFVIATKYGFMDTKSGVNDVGSHRKNLMRSVEHSLKRLKTDHIDLLWLHCPDGMTPIDETMRALDDLIRMGKIFYIGVSQMSAWEIARANTLAEFKNWTQFIAIQPEYNLLERSCDRDLIPMSKEMDLAITPWSPLAGGVLTGKYLTNEGKRVPKDSARFNQKNTEITQCLVNIANQLGHTPGQVALRWVMQKSDQMIPIVGARRLSQLEESLQTLEFKLDADTMKKLDAISKISLGYPHDFIKTDLVRKQAFGGLLDDVLNHRKK